MERPGAEEDLRPEDADALDMMNWQCQLELMFVLDA
jgi:hypothetical protein